MNENNSNLEKGSAADIKIQHNEREPSLQLDGAEKTLEKKTLLKLDLLLVPVMCAIYLFSFLDRANIGNARVAGLQNDLKLTDRQYQTAITVTYIPYICAELPSTLVIKRVGPRLMLPGMCLCWGIVATLQSQVHSYGGLLACRAFLGLSEGGLFPCIVLYLSGFYKPHELQVRVGLFFSAAALSGAFSGLLAAAIQQMEGIGGMHGWRWIFLLEGLFTVLFAAFAFYILPNTPHQVRHFTPEQADWCVSRLRSASIPESHKITLKAVWSTFKDLHIWMMCSILFCNGISLFGLAYFTPSIVASLGYGETHTQLLTVPPFACAFVVTMISAYVADRFKRRGLTAICTTCLALIGFSIFLATHTNDAKYTALCFMITGIYSAAPSLISWVPNNVAAHSRRATALAMAFIATNVGGIVSTWIYPKSSAPRYTFAARFNLSLVCISLTLMGLLVALLRYNNQKKAGGHRDGLLHGLSDMLAEEQHEILGDHHPSFKYTL